MSDEFWIGVDLGATNIKAASFLRSGEIHNVQWETHEDIKGRWSDAVRDMVGKLESALGGKAASICVAAPGLAARNGRSIAFMPGRMNGLEDFDWTDFFQRDQIVEVINDAQAALLGERWKGAAVGCDDVFMLTLGTGVGGAAVCDGRLLTGAIGRAGHLGHISLDSDGMPDVVGTPGSLEDAIGECTLASRSGGRFKETHVLVAAVRSGDSDAAEIWKKSIHKLACGIVSLINVLDPALVVIGGGISGAGQLLFDPLNEFVAQHEWRPAGHHAKIVPATLGMWAGAYGAAYFGMGAARK